MFWIVILLAMMNGFLLFVIYCLGLINHNLLKHQQKMERNDESKIMLLYAIKTRLGADSAL